MTIQSRTKQIQLRCPHCQEDTIHDMCYCEIDVDLRNENGIPIMSAYKCSQCEHNRKFTDYVESFVLHFLYGRLAEASKEGSS